MNCFRLKNIFLLIVTAIFFQGCMVARFVKFRNQIAKSSIAQEQFAVEIPFAYEGNYIVVKSKFATDASEKDFLVDTGAPTVITMDNFKANKFPTVTIFKDLPTTLKIDSLSASNFYSFSPKLPEVRLQDLVFKDVGAQVVNEKVLEKYACFASDGIIGSNLMNDAIWQFDYARQTITVTDDLNRLKHIEGAAKVKFKNFGKVKKPIIPVKLNGKKYWFLFDTGSSLGIVFSPDLLQFYGNVGPQRTSSFSMNGLRTAYTENDDKQFTGSFVNLPEFVLGDLKVKNASATALELPFFEKDFLTKKQYGNLGNKFFQNYIVTINWQKNLIYFAPQPNPVQPVVTSNFGILGRFNGQKKYVVQYLFKNSDAEKAGIKLNDEILAVNGLQMDNLSSDQYCEFMNNPEKLTPDNSKEATFLIRHSTGETKAYTFKRQELFPEFSEFTLGK